jgi:hypothetical protein
VSAAAAAAAAVAWPLALAAGALLLPLFSAEAAAAGCELDSLQSGSNHALFKGITSDNTLSE